MVNDKRWSYERQRLRRGLCFISNSVSLGGFGKGSKTCCRWLIIIVRVVVGISIRISADIPFRYE